MKHLALAATLGAGLTGCFGASADDKPTFAELRAETHRVSNGHEFYLVSGDIAVSEAELRDMYDHVYGTADGTATVRQDSIVNRVGRRDDKWSAARALNLTYCVTNDFGANKARAVAEMNDATAAWEAVAHVNFVYVPAQDATCTSANRNVVFVVRPWGQGGACAFFPSNPGAGCEPKSLVIDIADLDTNYGDVSPNVRTVGVFRHELGHILGLRHEHTRPNTGVCFEDNSWRALTPYDRSSVMHYPWCNGDRLSTLSITPSDATGVRALYGAP